MINIKAYVDDLEIIHSGNAHFKLSQVLKLNFNPIKIEISFLDDPKLDVNIIYKLEDDILKVVFQNYTDVTGSGVLQPWRIGEYQGRELFITIFAQYVVTENDNFLVCNYILYSGKEVKSE
ncbi:DUF6864 domain-containing function [uncultured Flavobacterium sp.]|uniref:DUF6864 domain-containing function n=1 Tax=uncultured Flavobacterium sp. TaxID=165435 RepID=UPI002600723C|nr:hypothetical protein [uncultured Flavobacterium sp.]